MRKKLKSTGGLTLVEMLCAVAILILLCLVVNAGIQMAVKNYRLLTGDAEAQLLLNTLSDAVSDKLRYCLVTEEKDESGTAVYANSVGEIILSDGKVLVKESSSDGTEKQKDLLPTGVYGLNRRYQVTDASVSVTDPGYVVGTQPVFTVKLSVKDTQTDLTKDTNLTVRCLNPVKKPVKEEGTTP